MNVVEFNILDKLSPWLRRKEHELPSLEEQLTTTLARLFVNLAKPYVPYERGYLENSAEHLWVIEPVLHYYSITVMWTGQLNPSREGHRDFIGDDGEYLDYALFQYFAPLRHEIKPSATDHWVDPTMKDFESKGMDTTKQMFLEWLFK